MAIVSSLFSVRKNYFIMAPNFYCHVKKRLIIANLANLYNTNTFHFFRLTIETTIETPKRQNQHTRLMDCVICFETFNGSSSENGEDEGVHCPSGHFVCTPDFQQVRHSEISKFER